MFAIILDNDNYIKSHSDKFRAPGAIIVETIPEETDPEKLQCYQYIDDAFVFDEEKWAEIEAARANAAAAEQAAAEQAEAEAEQAAILQEINALKAAIASTDYQIIKCYEYSLNNLEMPYDVAELHAKRQAIRDQINELESTL